MKAKTKDRKSAAEKLSSHGKESTIDGATASYETWMRSCAKILQSDLRSKHEQMKENPFGLLRGAFYLRVMFAVDDIDETLGKLRMLGAQLVGEVARYQDSYRLWSSES